MTAIELSTTNGAAPLVIDQHAILKSLNLNPNDPKTQALLLVCDRYGLDPLLKHAVLIQGSLYVTRDGLLGVAHRSGQFDGIEVVDQGETPTHYTAKVSVYRKDMGRPFTYVGRYPKQGGNKGYGPEMAVKCAEVMALRRAFNVTGIPAVDERWDVADSPQQHGPALPAAPVADPETGERLEPPAPQTTRRRPGPPTVIDGEPAVLGAAWKGRLLAAATDAGFGDPKQACEEFIYSNHPELLEADGKTGRPLKESAVVALAAELVSWLADGDEPPVDGEIVGEGGDGDPDGAPF